MPRWLRPEEHPALVCALGDTPLTVIPAHLLERNLARACVAGNPGYFAGAVIQDGSDPGEVVGFGPDAAVLAELLRLVDGWWAVSVEEGVAPELARLLRARTGGGVRLYGDVFHTLTRPVQIFSREAVRLLTTRDLGLLEAVPEEVRGSGWENTRGMLEGGVVAGAVRDGRLVALAFTSARTAEHADVAVATLEEWRGAGLATAAASAVSRKLQEAGQTPVWSCGEDNRASLAVARKLGFEPVSRKTYVILTGGAESRGRGTVAGSPGPLRGDP